MTRTLKQRAASFGLDLVVALVWAALPLAVSAYLVDFAHTPVASTILLVTSIAFGVCMAGANHGCFSATAAK